MDLYQEKGTDVPLKIVVAGLWHLGCVTAACLANKGFHVIGFDSNSNMIQDANNGILPIYEPGLDELTKKVRQSGHLTFSDSKEHFSQADIVWITFDTPVNDKDEADAQFVIDFVKSVFSYLKDQTIVIISSQLPVGSVTALQSSYNQVVPNKKVYFTCSPENLRLGKAIQIFENPDRIVIGLDDLSIKSRLEALLQPISSNILWVSVASAEMIKHAINAFLAVSVTFINEIANICESVGANASEVEKGLKTEERIGPKAYLKPGAAFAGGTLARDIDYLTKIGEKYSFPTYLMRSIKESNENHKSWVIRRLKEELGELAGKNIAIMGLTYKPGTNTLRRSSSIEICRLLTQCGAKVYAYDPVINHLPDDLDFSMKLKHNFYDLAEESDVIVVATEWPEFKDLNFSNISCSCVFDVNGFLAPQLAHQNKIKYFSVGRAS